MSKLCVSIYLAIDALRRAARGFGKTLSECRSRQNTDDSDDIAHLWRIGNVSEVITTGPKTKKKGRESIAEAQQNEKKLSLHLDEKTSETFPIAQFSKKIENEISIQKKYKEVDYFVGTNGHANADCDLPTITAIDEDDFEEVLLETEEDKNTFNSITQRPFTAPLKAGLGFLIFEAVYNDESHRLLIKLDKAIELPSKGRHKSYGILVKASLVPPNGRPKTVHKSKPSMHNVNPHFYETFTLELKKRKSRCYIRLSVFESGRQSLYEAIGHVLLPVKNISTKICQSYKLPLTHQTVPVGGDLGQVHLSLTFQPSQDKLNIGILRGRRLRLRHPSQKTGLAKLNSLGEDCKVYGKATLMCCGEKIKSVCTKMVPASSEPRFEESFSFVVPLTFLDDTSIVVSIYLRGLSKKDILVGRVISGPYICTQGEQLTQWGKMLDQGRTVFSWRDLCI